MSFAEPAMYNAGDTTFQVTCADLNDDGFPDLVAATTFLVSVFLNQGDGTFGAVRTYDASFPHRIAVDDFDEDGDQDLVTCSYWEPEISVLRNNGDGTFAAKVDFNLNSVGGSIESVDLDADTDYDLVIAHAIESGVTVLENDGSGVFSIVNRLETNGIPRDVDCADLNGDGSHDLAVTSSVGGTLSVLLNRGDGSFGERVDYEGGRGNLVSGDFSGSGFTDIAVVDPMVGDVIIFKNDGDGNFIPSLQIQRTGGRPDFVLTADWNGDGHADLATANGNKTVGVLVNQGNGIFAAKVDFPAGGSLQIPCSGDFNADGKPDIAVSHGGNATVGVLLNTTPAPDRAKLALAKEIRFPLTEVGRSSRVQVFRLENEGAVAVTHSRVRLRGPGRRDFSLTPPKIRSVPPYSTITIGASFRPRKAGTRRATVEVSSSAPTVRATLSGKGSDPIGVLSRGFKPRHGASQ